MLLLENNAFQLLTFAQKDSTLKIINNLAILLNFFLDRNILTSSISKQIRIGAVQAILSDIDTVFHIRHNPMPCLPVYRIEIPRTVKASAGREIALGLLEGGQRLGRTGLVGVAGVLQLMHTATDQAWRGWHVF